MAVSPLIMVRFSKFKKGMKLENNGHKLIKVIFDSYKGKVVKIAETRRE